MTDAEHQAAYARMLVLLSRSRFRSRFHLGLEDRQYIGDKGWDTIRRHAEDFVAKRLAPAHIPNDGKQTPMRGHPVFLAQHATACCCRQLPFQMAPYCARCGAHRRAAGICGRHAAVLAAA